MAILLGGVPAADGHRLVVQRVEVDRDSERRANLVVPPVAPADVAAGLLVLHAELAVTHQAMSRAGKIPGARFHLCRNGSHMCMYDDQESYFDALISFVTQTA